MHKRQSITENGNHPLVFIVQDIAAPGTSKVILIQKPSGEVEPWEVYITTTAPQAELESYFIFVVSEGVVSYFKLTPCCLFEQPEFSKYIMPREAVAINAANQVLSLADMPSKLISYF